MAGRQKHNFAPRIANRKALHDYNVLEKFEVGIVLQGSEVKAIRLGRANLTEGFARVEPRTDELWLYNAEIGLYPEAGSNQHPPTQPRKLLARKRQIKHLQDAVSAAGGTLIPLALYFKGAIVKVEIGVCTGKRQHDKRQDLKKKQADRDIRRAMTRKVIR